MTVDELVAALRAEKTTVLVLSHDCSGSWVDVAFRQMQLGWQPDDQACPVCGAIPTRQGFRYEWALLEDVPSGLPELKRG